MVQYISAKNEKWTGNNGDNSCINRECACTKTTREGQTRADTSDYICKQLPVNYKLNQVAQINDNLKTQLCNKLIQEGKIKENDVIRHSYSSNRLKNGDKNMGRIENHEGLSPTLDTRCDCLGIVVNDNSVYTNTEKKLFTEDGNIKRYIGSDIVDKFEEGQMATTSYPNGYGHGPRTHNESISLNTIDKPTVKKNHRIRKLIPLECLRLMGVRDEYSQRMTCSNAQKYKQAGNGIVVDVLMAIFKQML